MAAPDSILIEETGASGSEVAPGPPPADHESERMPQDRIPGLDDLEFRPEPATAPLAEAPESVEAFTAPENRVDHGMGEPSAPAAGGCRSCGAELPSREGLRFCPACGANQDRWPCPACGQTVERGWRFCAMCGAKQ